MPFPSLARLFLITYIAQGPISKRERVSQYRGPSSSAGETYRYMSINSLMGKTVSERANRVQRAQVDW